MIPSWRDVATGSEFIRRLFFTGEGSDAARRILPGHLTHYLLFGVSDTTISLQSAIRWEALEEADARWPLNYGHVEILRSRESSELLAEALESTFP